MGRCDNLQQTMSTAATSSLPPYTTSAHASIVKTKTNKRMEKDGADRVGAKDAVESGAAEDEEVGGGYAKAGNGGGGGSTTGSCGGSTGSGEGSTSSSSPDSGFNDHNQVKMRLLTSDNSKLTFPIYKPTKPTLIWLIN